MAETDIAVVGMGCRLPGAPDLDAFWSMLRDGRDARRELTEEHLRSVGVPPEVLRNPDFVKAAMVLDDIDQFDAGFFGFSPRDASLFDPQHRVWLEVCWEAFEHAGHVPDKFDGRIGVFAGCGMDTYLIHNVLTNPDLVRQIGMFLIRHTGNDKDFLATRTSYQFDLRGPSVNVLTACSTSLVAIHQAAGSLLAGECDMALAGGVTILVPQDRGYVFKEGEVLSPDGVCRTFDANSKGTIFGSGAGVVVLRRLQDAIDDGDQIHAVVSGSAVNNDGARKVSYLAPSVDGYAEVVAEALALADVPAESVQYVEAHGTGTSVGDPIEIEALTQAFRASTSKSDYCGIGSVKTNIGHLDTAAGVAGLLKVVLAMKHGELPASLHFEKPNPLIDFARSPFHVASEKRDWPRPAGGERTAGISSLGVGGTNAHLIVKESLEQPAEPGKTYPRRCHLLPISGKGKDAAVANAGRMAAWLGEHQDAELADVAWTMQHGRRAFSHRGVAVGANAAELAQSLQRDDWKPQLKKAPDRAPSVVFLFPGGGAQYPGMAKELYEFEPAFREAADACLAALPDPTRGNVYEILFGAETQPEKGDEMERPSLLLPTLFVVEYSLAMTMRSFGIEADAMLGHSLGEYVAATLGGTWTLEQVLPVLVLRGECMELSEAGAVVSVSLPAAEIQALGDGELSLSAANAPELSAVAGSPVAIERFEQSLKERDVDYQRLRIGVGAHSHLLDTVLDRFREGLRKFSPQPAKKPWVSNITGEWVDPDRAADIEYWVEHVRRTVRFEDGVATLLDGGDRVFVEIGPGKALTSLVRMHERARKSSALVTVPHPKDGQPADSFLLEAVGKLWQLGVPVDWQAFHGGVTRRRVSLPTYAFQRQRHWIEPGTSLSFDGGTASSEPTPPTRLPDSEWLKKTEWRPRELSDSVQADAAARWLVVGDDSTAAEFANQVQSGGGRVTAVVNGPEQLGSGTPSLPFEDADAWARLLDRLAAQSGLPNRILLAEGPVANAPAGEDAVVLVRTLVAMVQALGRADATDGLRLLAMTQGAASVATEAMTRPSLGALPGFLRVVPREFPGLVATWVDVDAAGTSDPSALAATLRREVEAESGGMGTAWRAGKRFVQELLSVEVDAGQTTPWRTGGTFLITGGLGGIGMMVAEHLARQCQAKLALVSRRGLPPRAVWDEWLKHRVGDRVSQLILRIRQMEQVGAEIEVLAADVTDLAAMQGVVQTITSRFGALHGVVHTAGVLDDGLILMRSSEQTERVMRPKVVGAQVLDEATLGHDLDQFVVFGSTSGLAGIPGQCDYAAANAALDAFAVWRSQMRKGRTLSVDWGIWQDAGMLAEASEMSLPSPSWLGRREEQGDRVSFAATWSAADNWVLSEHRIKGGDCVMPGTGHVELMTAAVQTVANAAQVTLSRVELLTPLAFPGDQSRAVIVTVDSGRDGYEVTVASAATDGAAEHERTTHARAVARPGTTGDGLLDVAACRAAAPDPAPPTSDQGRHVDFGPRWQCIESVGTSAEQVLGSLRLPDEYAADLEQHRAHPAMVDMAFGCGIRLLSSSSPDALFVPVGCEQVVVHGRMPAAVVSHVVLQSYDERSRLGTLDVTIATPSGVVVLELRGLSVFGVHGQFGSDVPAATTAAPSDAKPAATRPPVEVAKPRIEAILARGITGPEGMLGLERALQTGLPRVVVSSLDVQRAADWLSLPPEQPRAPRSFGESSTSSGDEDAPRDATEKSVAAAFGELLGVDSPSLDDDFFELGGHSLLAVRLFARIHKEFGVDLELATLLSSGTVRKLAALLREELDLPEPGDAPEPVRSVAANKGQHVVPIQTEGTRPKLFLVHGAGGNVLGFRDLSHYFGKNQPLYGLQARGVDGKNKPFTTIAEMAKSYLAELREVQPHGPYYLGGYSGGGVIAYEMAQLLREVGEPVAYVGLIDSWCTQIRERSKLTRAWVHFMRLAKKGPLYPFRVIKGRIDRRAAERDTAKANEQGGPLPQEQRGYAVQFAFENAFLTHTVKPYEGDVWLFRADIQEMGTRYIFDADLGWGPFAKNIEVRACPGNHYTMCTEPNVQVLCGNMMAAMDEAIAKAGSGQ